MRRPPGRPEVVGEPIVTSTAAAPGYPVVPFVGVAEGMVLAAFRRAGVSLQHIRSAVSILQQEIGASSSCGPSSAARRRGLGDRAVADQPTEDAVVAGERVA